MNRTGRTLLTYGSTLVLAVALHQQASAASTDTGGPGKALTGGSISSLTGQVSDGGPNGGVTVFAGPSDTIIADQAVVAATQGANQVGLTVTGGSPGGGVTTVTVQGGGQIQGSTGGLAVQLPSQSILIDATAPGGKLYSGFFTGAAVSAASNSGSITIRTGSSTQVYGAVGFAVSGGASQTIDFGNTQQSPSAPANAQVSSFTGYNAAVADLSGSSGAVSFHANGGLSVTTDAQTAYQTGSAAGVSIAGGTTQTVRLDGALTVNGVSGNNGTGLTLSGATGAVAVDVGGLLTVTGGGFNGFGAPSNRTGTVTGVSVSGGTDQTVQLESGLIVAGAGAATTGLLMAGGSGAISFTSGGPVTLTFEKASVTQGQITGLVLDGGKSQTVTIGGDVSIGGGGPPQSAFGMGYALSGIALQNAAGAESLSIAGALTVNGTAATLSGGTDQTVNLAKVTANYAPTGIALSSATGAINVHLTGLLTANNAGGDVTGVNLSGGHSQNLVLDQGLSVTGSPGDPMVGSQMNARGVVLDTGGDALVSVGATLEVLGTFGSATGLAIDGNHAESVLLDNLTVDSLMGSATGLIVRNEGASDLLSVQATGQIEVSGFSGPIIGTVLSGGGSQSVDLMGGVAVTNTSPGQAIGIQMSGASGAIHVTTGGAFSVVAGGGAIGAVLSSTSGDVFFHAGTPLTATGTFGLSGGVIVSGGGAETVALDGGANVLSSAGQAVGVQLSGGSGGLSVNAGGLLSVRAGTLSATGVSLSGGTSQTVDLAAGATVSGSAAVTGVQIGGGSGALAVSAQGPLSVTTNSPFPTLGAQGVVVTGGASQSVSLTSGLTVQAPNLFGGGASATGILMSGADGSVNVATGGAFNVAAGGGATGVQISGGGTQTVNLQGTAAVASASSATGALLSGASGDVVFHADGPLAVTGQAGIAAGVVVSGGGAQTVAFDGGAIITNAPSQAVGVQLSGGSGSLTVSAGGLLSVRAGALSSTGVSLSGGTSQTVDLAAGATVSGAAGVVGVQLGGGADALAVSAEGLLNVTTNSSFPTSGAQGVVIDGGTNQWVRLSAGIYVGDTTLFASSPSATGLQLSGGSGSIAVSTAGPISIAGGAGAAALLISGGGIQTVAVTGPTTVSAAAGLAIGVSMRDASSAANLAIGGTLTVSGPGATGVAVAAGGPITVVDTSSIAVQALGSASSGVGVSVATTDTRSDLSVTLASVNTTGVSTPGVVLQSGTTAAGVATSGAIAATLGSVTTMGQNAVGVSAIGSATGATNLVVGSVVGNTLSGVATFGSQSTAVSLSTFGGAGVVTNNGVVATYGSNATGILASASGGGALSVTNFETITNGQNSTAISLTTTSGAVSLSSTETESAGGLDRTGAVGAGRAINIATGSGSVTVSSVIAAADGLGAPATAMADAIHITSVSGSVNVKLADGGFTRSATAAGVSIQTGGVATLALGTAATTASVYGATWGLQINAAGGSTLDLSGVVGAQSNGALTAGGGATTIVNTGVINGFMSLSRAGSTFSNAGVWNAFGGDTDFGGGVATFTNTGVLNVYMGAGAPSTLSLKNLTTLNNSGVINLHQIGTAHAGDVLDLGAAAYTGSGGAKLVVDVSLAGLADELKAGSVSGSTLIVLNLIGPTMPGGFNFPGIRVVTAGMSAPNAFTLQGGAAGNGFYVFNLQQDGANYDLVTTPGVAFFELARAGAEAQRFWRRSGDAWAEQMRGGPYGEGRSPQGFSIWAQASTAEDTERSRPTFTLTAPTPMSFHPSLDTHDDFAGAQFGFDYGFGGLGVGLTTGFGDQAGAFGATHDRLNVKGYNIGAYGRVNADGWFGQALVKLDQYTVDYQLASASVAPQIAGRTYGLDLQGGYHLALGALFIEPVGALSLTRTSMDPLAIPAATVAADDARTDSAYASAGLRAGLSSTFAGWTLRPFAGAYVEREMAQKNLVAVSFGASTAVLADQRPGAYVRAEAGLDGRGPGGWSAFINLADDTGRRVTGATARMGVALRW